MNGRGSIDVDLTASDQPRPRGRPRNVDLEGGPSSRDKLLDAAITLFAMHGYDPVTTGSIAESAGMTQSMVHYHFGSKAKLWEAAIDHLMRDRGGLFPPARLKRSDLAPIERLRNLVRSLVEANAAQPHFARIAMHEGMTPGPRLDWLVERYMGPGYALFDRAVEDAIAAGAIPDMPVPDVTNVLTSAASLVFSLGAVIDKVHGRNMSDPDHVRTFTDTILKILFRGLDPGADVGAGGAPTGSGTGRDATGRRPVRRRGRIE